MPKEIKTSPDMMSKNDITENEVTKDDRSVFIKVMSSFVQDISTTFPEYRLLLEKKAGDMDYMYNFCKRKYLVFRDDILSKNAFIFDEDGDVDTEFLPSVHFKNLWQYEDLSETSKEMIWRYLQLILLTLGTADDEPETNETSMETMISNMTEFFSNLPTKTAPESSETPSPSDPSADPDVPSLDQFEGMFGKKLTSLAKEIAESSASILDIDETTTPEQAISQVFSNPAKLSKMMTTLTTSLDEKMKSGELNQNEFMDEALGMLGKMGSMPGGLGGIFSALSNFEKTPKYNQLSRVEKQKERIRSKLRNKNMK